MFDPYAGGYLSGIFLCFIFALGALILRCVLKENGYCDNFLDFLSIAIGVMVMITSGIIIVALTIKSLIVLFH